MTACGYRVFQKYPLLQLFLQYTLAHLQRQQFPQWLILQRLYFITININKFQCIC